MKILRHGLVAASTLLTGLLFSALPAMAEVQQEHGLGLPRDVSLNGHLIDWLINVTMGFVALLFIIMCAWMGWACWKHGKNHPPEYEHGDGRHSVTVALSISALIFFVVDGNLFFNSVRDVGSEFWNFKKVNADPNVLRVEVNAHQWAWDFRYAGPDGKFGTQDDIVSLNELRVPTGRPVLLQLAATDVLHSFYLPNLRVKIDAVPGNINQTWFQAVQTGDFDIACAQHCGINHYLMKGRLTIVDPKDFDGWTAQASAVSSLAYDDSDKSGHWGWAWQEL